MKLDIQLNLGNICWKLLIFIFFWKKRNKILGGEYSQKLGDDAKQSAADAFKVACFKKSN